jgi:RNA 3'-terminal phosphate cyclase (ATP)
MIDIDGAHGEGGGQLVRTAVAVAAMRGLPIRIVDIRARRAVPGLAAQHVAAVRAVAALCEARCTGVELRSTTLTFEPARLRGGAFEIDVGTAGSVTLVLQAMLPAAVASGQRVAMHVRGGTDVRGAPPLDYLRHVLLPLLVRLGVAAELQVVRRGYYPRGGGDVRLDLAPTARLTPLAARGAGSVPHVAIHAHVSRLPRTIAERMEQAARAELPAGLAVHSAIEVCAGGQAAGPGGAIVLSAPCGRTTLGAGRVAERGIRAEQLGIDAARSLNRDLQAGATLDAHAADQMLVFLAMAPGASVFRTSQLSSHAATAMWLLGRMTPARCDVEQAGGGVLVRVQA